MQGKGLIQFFFIILVIVCLYQLSFTWKANAIEKNSREYAEANVPDTLQGEERTLYIDEKRSEYLSQKANETVYNLGVVKYNYEEVKERALNLGLDLQGGMSVVLEVSKYDLIKGLSNNPKNPKLIDALDKARIDDSKGKGELVSLFVNYYEQANPGSQLVSLFRTNDNADKIAATASNAEVEAYLKNEADAGVQSTYTKLKQRIDKFGVSQPNISLQKSIGRIVVELPGVDNPKQVRKLLQSTANLQFWQTWTIQELQANLTQANEALTGILENTVGLDSTKKTDSTKQNITSPFTNDTTSLTQLNADSTKDTSGLFGEVKDTAGNAPDSVTATSGPLFKVLNPTQNPGPVIGYVNIKDTSTLMMYLNMEEVRSVFPPNLIFMLGAQTLKTDKNIYEVYAMKTELDDNKALLEGDVISSASQDYNPTNGQPEVTMTMKSDGAKKWRRITADSKGKYIAITLDNQVYSAPVIREEIPNGRSSISGNFDVKEAQVLADILEVGKLPVPSKIVQEDIVGPSLGAESIRSGIISMIVGLILVILFMIFYYSTAGFVADLALFANIFFIFGVLASIGATLTLPGIAGILLTMGMAVDANVIIYERVREELQKGKSMIKAIADGYRGSYSAIIDSHVTTFIIGIILQQFGTGPIKGFAVVLMIGIIFSLFTAIFISRLILEWMARTGKPISYYTHLTKGAFKHVNFKFMQKRRIGYIFSVSLTVIGLIFMLTSGFNMGVEFKGGRSYTVKFQRTIDAEEVRKELSADFDKGVQVKTYSSSDKLKITTEYMIGSPDPKADSLATLALYNKLSKYYTNVDFKTWDLQYKESQMKVEPTIAQDIQTSAVRAIILALLATFIYIVIRFRKWQFGLGAVISLIHDAFMTLAVFSILKNVMPFTLQIDETFVAAILTIIGYSIMDTVVVYDRIREFVRESRSGTIPEIFNAAINQTLSRTVITSSVTILSIIVILFFGNDNIQGFAFAMCIGIAFGTYSSVFIASAIAVDLYSKKHREEIAAEKVLK